MKAVFWRPIWQLYRVFGPFLALNVLELSTELRVTVLARERQGKAAFLFTQAAQEMQLLDLPK